MTSKAPERSVCLCIHRTDTDSVRSSIIIIKLKLSERRKSCQTIQVVQVEAIRRRPTFQNSGKCRRHAKKAQAEAQQCRQAAAGFQMKTRKLMMKQATDSTTSPRDLR